jgi:hypothetical protein
MRMERENTGKKGETKRKGIKREGKWAEIRVESKGKG